MGQLRTRKRGTTWEWSFEGARINRKRNSISKGGYRTKAEALAAGTQAKAEYDNAGSHFVPSEISVSDFYQLWLEKYCKTNLKIDTYLNYKKKVSLHITPILGSYYLKSLTPAIIQGFINDKFNAGYSRNTLSVLKGLLTGALDYAVEPMQFIKYNPAKSAKLPPKRATSQIPTRKKIRTPISSEEWSIIISRFPEGHSCHIPLQLAYRCGLRLGESFALTWDDVDFENSTLSVNQQIQNVNGAWVFSNPKYDSFRTIELDEKMLSLLRNTYNHQVKAKEFYEQYYAQLYVDDQCVLNADGRGKPIHMVNCRENGTYIQPRVMQHCCRVIHYNLGFKDFDYHSLRHTHATMLLEAGADIKDVQKRLGHKHIDVTLDIYSHAPPRMAAHTIDILNQIE